MNLPRRDFLKCSLSALGLAALGASHVFAAPMGSLLPTMNRAGDRASVPASSSSLRVGSYNVRVGTADGKTANAWDNRKEDLVALTRLIDYDVVGLQESFTAQSAYITNSLPGYALIGSIEGAEENVGVTSPICYRKARLTPLKSGTFSGWKWREKEYSAVDALKLPADVRNARKGSLKLPPPPLRISADVRNARKGSPDADRDADGRHKWKNCGARIDYIYVLDGVKVKSYATRADSRPGTKLYPSDHFPLVAEIELSQTPNGHGK